MAERVTKPNQDPSSNESTRAAVTMQLLIANLFNKYRERQYTDDTTGDTGQLAQTITLATKEANQSVFVRVHKAGYPNDAHNTHIPMEAIIEVNRLQNGGEEMQRVVYSADGLTKVTKQVYEGETELSNELVSPEEVVLLQAKLLQDPEEHRGE